MMTHSKIAAVSYLNTIPFVFGIKSKEYSLQSTLLLDVPARCTQNFTSRKADIALVPCADLQNLSDYKIITSFCLSAVREVRTVVIMSNCPASEIETIHLDCHSHTSVQLVKIIANQRWGIKPNYLPLTDYSIVGKGSKNEAYLLIGDKVFEYENNFSFTYDLASEWIESFSMPFVFAVWVARPHVSEEAIAQLENALDYGTKHIAEAIVEEGFGNDFDRNFEYLTKNLDYSLTEEKKAAIEAFLQKIPPSSSI